MEEWKNISGKLQPIGSRLALPTWHYAGNGIPGPVSTRLVFGHLNTVKPRIVKLEFRYVEVKRLCNADLNKHLFLMKC